MLFEPPSERTLVPLGDAVELGHRVIERSLLALEVMPRADKGEPCPVTDENLALVEFLSRNPPASELTNEHVPQVGPHLGQQQRLFVFGRHQIRKPPVPELEVDGGEPFGLHLEDRVLG